MTTQLEKRSHETVENWIQSCTRRGKVSRNTIAIGIVVLDHLRRQSPVLPEDVISPGGEVKGSRSGLGNILETYGIPGQYLKEVTTRQAHPDGQRLFEAFNWGQDFAVLRSAQREKLLLSLIALLVDRAKEWLRRQNLKLDIDRRHAPTTWIKSIVDNAQSRSGGVVEQHLVGAKLARRFPDRHIPNHPAHAADRQTGRAGDFTIAQMVYHVTATPSRSVIQKCAENIRAGMLPVLLVPASLEYKAVALAEDEGINNEMSVISIENFVAMNIIELAAETDRGFFNVLQEIVELYNERLAQVETDLSLQIEVH